MDRSNVITIEKDENFLRQISIPVKKDDENLLNDINVLEEFCKSNDVLAMAAVQLGIPKRIVYLKNTNLELINKINSNEASEEEENYNEAKVLINPIIVSKEGLTEYWEACASCLDNMGLVKRPYKIVVEYVDKEFKKHKDTFEGFESTVLSHEIDHLDGILHMDIAEEVLVLTKEERKVFRKHHDYVILNKNGSFEEIKK